jgi:hypothetical protein
VTREEATSSGEVGRLAEVVERVEAAVAVVARAREAVAARHEATSSGWPELEEAEAMATETGAALDEAASVHAQAATAHAYALHQVQARRAAVSEFSRKEREGWRQ